uniref:Uncharacterized protein n=1 Tax=Rhizophora mucronata TaxID=61149 RepID=A0A2P2Q4R5_RHIMU
MNFFLPKNLENLCSEGLLSLFTNMNVYVLSDK